MFLASLHRCITDGWSAMLLQNNLTSAYAASQAGSQPAWDPLSVLLMDRAAWRTAMGGRAMRKAQLALWKALADALPLLELPWDRQRLDAMPFVGANLDVSMPAETGRGLLKRAANQVTNFVMTFTSLQVSSAPASCRSSTAVDGKYNTAQTEIALYIECWTLCRLWCPSCWCMAKLTALP